MEHSQKLTPGRHNSAAATDSTPQPWEGCDYSHFRGEETEAWGFLLGLASRSHSYKKWQSLPS
jgi:hypothetical protein